MKTCNKCGKEMNETGLLNFKTYDRKGHIDDEHFYCVCTNSKCRNYALVQIPVEDMPKSMPKGEDE
jgi:hypothetical protein